MEIVYFVISFIEILVTILIAMVLCKLNKIIKLNTKEYDLSEFKNVAKLLNKTSKIHVYTQINPVEAIISFIKFIKTLKTVKEMLNSLPMHKN